jgi:hypothetical protein
VGIAAGWPRIEPPKLKKCSAYNVRLITGPLPVAAAEQREAAFGCAAVVNSDNAVHQIERVFRSHDCFAAERSLALLRSCYKNREFSHTFNGFY